MSNSIIIVIIPSKTIRKQCRNKFPDFGEQPETTAVAISSTKSSYLPVDERSIDLVILSERKLSKDIRLYLNKILETKEYIFVGKHREAEDFDYSFIDLNQYPQKKIAVLEFHRVDSNPFYQALKDLCQYVDSPVPAMSLDENIGRLRNCFNIDWDLEDVLQRKHSTLVLPEDFIIPDDVLIAWNADAFGINMQKHAGGAHVALSEEEFNACLPHKKHVIILSELTWNCHKMSQFYGYEIAREFFFTHDGFDLAFVSCIPRTELQKVNPDAQLMVPVFHHYLFPFENQNQFSFQFYKFSVTKQRIIKNYFLKPDGVVDKLLHDLKKISRNSGRESLLELVIKIKSYHAILPPDIISYADYVYKKILEKASVPIDEIRKLQHNLEDHYENVITQDNGSERPTMHPFKLMIVEDNEDDLAALENGFSRLVQEVICFRSGEEALNELEKNHTEYGAIIVDMELLDADGNWQDVQGFEIIEHVKKYPHLVVTMLTGYSKRAIATINEMLAASTIIYLPKYPVFVLPPNWSYASFADHIAELVKQNQKFLSGPQNGIWKRGMLHFYHETINSIDKDTFIGEIQKKVSEFIDTENREKDLIPRKLFNVNTKKFDLEQLRAVLKHRLVCLYYQQESRNGFQFERGLKKYLAFNLSNPKQYLITLLGFSAQCTKQADGNHICTIELSNLFGEEEAWLRQFQSDPANGFPNFIEAMKEVVSYLTDFELENMDGTRHLEYVADCLPVCEAIVIHPPMNGYDMQVELNSYRENNPEEYKRLKLDEHGKLVVHLIEQFLRRKDLDNFE